MDNIDIINNIALSTSGNGLDAANQPDSSKVEPVDTSDPTVKAQFASIIEKAIQTEEVNLKAIEEAQNELDSGLLDTPQVITAAAQNILKYGI